MAEEEKKNFPVEDGIRRIGCSRLAYAPGGVRRRPGEGVCFA